MVRATHLLAAPTELAIVAGMGRFTLDVVVQPGQPLRAQAGGTSANVLANLAFLGWRALAVGEVGEDAPGQLVRQDLARAGVDTSRLRLVPGLTTLVTAHHVRDGRHEFTAECPLCGLAFPGFQPMPEGRLEALPPVRAFIFDEDFPSSLRAARQARESGAVVVYEPNYAGPEVDLPAALEASDIVRCSASATPGLADRVPQDGRWLVVETHGAAGLRYRCQGGWRHLPALMAPHVRDAGGAGDWLTAGLIHGLSLGAPLEEALGLGMALAAHGCAFVGARGSQYALSRDQLARDVGRLLAGEPFDPGAGVNPSLPEAGRFCVCRVGSPDSTSRQPAEPP
jgi:fructokinase